MIKAEPLVNLPFKFWDQPIIKRSIFICYNIAGFKIERFLQILKSKITEFSFHSCGRTSVIFITFVIYINIFQNIFETSIAILLRYLNINYFFSFETYKWECSLKGTIPIFVTSMAPTAIENQCDWRSTSIW